MEDQGSPQDFKDRRAGDLLALRAEAALAARGPRRRSYRFPHTRQCFKHTANGVEYTVTTRSYSRVLSGETVYMEMVIEGPNGYKRVLHGDAAIHPVMQRIWDSHRPDPCETCAHRKDVHGHEVTNFRWGPCKTEGCDCSQFLRTRAK